MAKGDDRTDEVTALLRRTADEERRLLKRERRAERELDERRELLARDQERLERAQARLERRRADVAEAETALRERQSARATGPTPPSEETASLPATPAATPTVVRRRKAATASRGGRGNGVATADG